MKGSIGYLIKKCSILTNHLKYGQVMQIIVTYATAMYL